MGTMTNAGGSSGGGGGGGGGKVLQVVQNTKTDTATTTSTTMVASGLSGTITPSATSSKVLVTAHVSVDGANSGTDFVALDLRRGTTSIYQGDADGTRIRASALATGAWNGGSGTSATITFLDSPNTTSAVTYNIYWQVAGTTGTIHMNRSASDFDSTARGRYASNIILTEIDGS